MAVSQWISRIDSYDKIGKYLNGGNIEYAISLVLGQV